MLIEPAINPTAPIPPCRAPPPPPPPHPPPPPPPPPRPPPNPTARTPEPPPPRTATRYNPSMFRLDGKTALVTGAGSGIGEAIAHTLARAGALVYVADRDAVNGRRVAEAIVGEAG